MSRKQKVFFITMINIINNTFFLKDTKLIDCKIKNIVIKELFQVKNC